MIAKKKSKPVKRKGAQIKKRSPGAEAVGISTVIDWLGISDERIRQLVREARIPKPAAKNRYDLKGAVRGYIKFLSSETRRSTNTAQDARLTEARAKQIELRTAREIGELVPAEEASAVLQTVVGTMMSALNSLPAQVTRNLEERQKIEAVIDGIRMEVALLIERLGQSYTEIDELEGGVP